METSININVPWATADSSSLVDGEGVVNITTEAHTGRVRRTGEAVVDAGGARKNVLLVQEGKPAFVSFKTRDVSIGADGGSITIEGKGNTSFLRFISNESQVSLPQYFSIKTSDGYIYGHQITDGQRFTSDPGAKNEYQFTITVTIGKNSGEETKEYTLQCTDGNDASSVIFIRQDGNQEGEDEQGTIKCTPVESFIDQKKQTVRIYIECDTNWIVKQY